MDENKLDEEIDENKNKNLIICQYCKSVILKKRSAIYNEDEFNLPLLHQKNTVALTELEMEKLNHFWEVDDMFTFENIGFSHTVHNIKYLVCADCEMGPIGYHNITTKKCYVALKRVKHVEHI